MYSLQKVYRSILLLGVFISCAQVNYSQVTIGSSITPEEGALLDLKEYTPTTNNITASKGLSLPRVRLSSLDKIIGNIDGVTDDNQENHIGLLIYNTNKCIGIGPHSWDGNKWENLYPINKPLDQTSFNPTTEILSDYNGNLYSTKIFGEYRWITSNLRSTHGADGLPIDCEKGLRMVDPTLEANAISIIVYDKIPEGNKIRYKVKKIDYSIYTTLEMTREQYAARFGLSYTREQAKRACPRGWYLPGEAEWSSLVQSIGEGTINWNNTANGAPHYMTTNLKGTTDTYASEWPAISTAYPWGTIEPNDPNNYGFDLLPAGGVNDDGVTARFGFDTAFWMNNSKRVDAVMMHHSNNPISYHFSKLISPMWVSVRCVQKIEQ